MDNFSEEISATKIGMYRRCPAQAWFRYAMGIKKPPGSALIFGRAHDTAANFTYEQMIGGGDAPSEEVAGEVFADEWAKGIDEAEELGGVKFAEGEEPGGLLDLGVLATKTWHREIAVHQEPVATQVKLEVDVPITEELRGRDGYVLVSEKTSSVKLIGYIDVTVATDVDQDGVKDTVHCDSKTSGKRWSESRALNEIQPMIYSLGSIAQGLQADPGEFRFHIVTKAKTPATQIIRVPVDDQQRKHGQVLISSARAGMMSQCKTGDILPNRDHFLCSKKWCGYWQKCEAEFGGRVKS